MSFIYKKLKSIIIRNFSTTVFKDRNNVMRMIYLKVHPDLFHNYKDAKVVIFEI